MTDKQYVQFIEREGRYGITFCSYVFVNPSIFSIGGMGK